MLRIALILIICITSFPSLAYEKLEFSKISVAQTEKLFDFYDYHGEKDYLMLPSYHYPPLFFKHFPYDFAQITDEKKRNAMFIKILAPLALQLNQEIVKERKKIKLIADNFDQTSKLTKSQSQFIEQTASKYDIFTHLKGYQRNRYLIDELLQRVHVVLPSILITAAAIETNWGTSRIVKEANSLYKTLVWHTDKGLKPIGETQDDSYRIKIYPDIYSSMQEFALKLNSSISFSDFRGFRNRVLERNTPLLGSTLAPYMVWNSPLKNYAGLFDYTLSYYELNIIDKSVLDCNIISKKLPHDLQKLTF